MGFRGILKRFVRKPNSNEELRPSHPSNGAHTVTQEPNQPIAGYGQHAQIPLDRGGSRNESSPAPMEPSAAKDRSEGDPLVPTTVPNTTSPQNAVHLFDHHHVSTMRDQVQESGLFHSAKDFSIHGGTFNSNVVHVYGGASSVRLEGLQILQRTMAPGAQHNSADRFDPPKCHPETRTAVLEEIMGWIQDTQTPHPILCIDGPAGCGKSAIQQTLSEKCEELEILAASFFFSASWPLRNNETSFIITLAYQIAISIPDTRIHIARAVENDPSVIQQSLERQLMVLLVEPIRNAGRNEKLGVWPYAIIIDGLDECQGDKHQALVLHVIRMALITYNLPFRIVLASRPEYAFRTAMDDGFCNVARRLTLDDSYNPEKDIELFLRNKFADIRRRNKYLADKSSWPMDGNIETLVDKSSGQFIYAATVIKFIDEYRHNPAKRLQMVLDWTPSSTSRTNPFKGLDFLYANILRCAQEGLDADDDQEEFSIVHFVRKILTIDRFFIEGISMRFVDKFFHFNPGDSQAYLSDLHSLIAIPHEVDSTGIRPYHKSFSEYLEDPARSGAKFVPKSEIDKELAILSMRCLNRSSAQDLNRVSILSLEPTPFEYAIYSWITLLDLAPLTEDLRDEFLSFDYEHRANIVMSFSHGLGRLLQLNMCIASLMNRIQTQVDF